MDDPRLERVRAQLRDVQASLAELDRRRTVSIATAEAARGRIGTHSRVDELRRQLDDALAELEGLRIAMQTRGVIEQAKGMLMLRLDVDADAAFAQLRAVSNDSNTRLVEVAEQVVRTHAGERSPA